MFTPPTLLAGAAAALVASSSVAALPHFLDPRAPHFSEIMAPEPDYVLRANDSASNGSVAFTYRNGERADETTMTVSLVNGNETYTLASNVSFYNSWYVNATLTVVYDQIPDGNYTLIAQEYLDGDVYSEVAQPFGISHDPNSPAPTGDMSSVDPNATPTSSAYILQPPSSEGGSVNQEATSTAIDGQATSLALTREEVIDNAAAATASSSSDTPVAVHDHTEDNDETIEANLHEFVEGVNSSDA